MPWIELHSNLREHPKTALLVEAMGFADADHAVGKLARLWLWALEYAPTGRLDQLTEKQLAVASGVDPKDGNEWLAALVSARWLDSKPYLRIHDWWDYAGYYLKKKWEKQPQKWQDVQQGYGTAADPPRIRSGTAAEPHTCTNQTNQTNQPGRDARAREASVPDRDTAVAMTAVAGVDPKFAGYVWDDWSGRGGKDAAGIDRDWLNYVKTRWERERKEWLDGTHKGNKHNGPSTHHKGAGGRNEGIADVEGYQRALAAKLERDAAKRKLAK